MCELGFREDWLYGRKLDVSPNKYGLLVKWLRHLPFTQVARVQFSYRLPNPRLGYESYPNTKLSNIWPHPLIGPGVQTFNLAIGVRTSVGSPRKSKNSSVKQMCGYFETLNETLIEHGFLLGFQLPPALKVICGLAVGREYNK